MLPIVVVLAIAVPFMEIVVLFVVAHVIGWPIALLLFVGLPFAGGWILRREGLGAWQRLLATVRQRSLPGRALADSALVSTAGVLLVVPGFVSAAFGGLLLIVPVRNLAATGLIGLLRQRFEEAPRHMAAKINRERHPVEVDLLANAVVRLPPAPEMMPGPAQEAPEVGWGGAPPPTVPEQPVVASEGMPSGEPPAAEAPAAPAASGAPPEEAAWAAFADRTWEEAPERRRGRRKKKGGPAGGAPPESVQEAAQPQSPSPLPQTAAHDPADAAWASFGDGQWEDEPGRRIGRKKKGTR